MKRLTGSMLNIIISILVIAIVEYYCYAALKSSIKHWSTKNKKRAQVVYWILNLFFWAAILLMPKYMGGTGVVVIDNYLTVMAMGGVFGKIIVAIIMLIADVILLINKWMNHARVRKIAIQHDEDTNQVTLKENESYINRSEFISRMSLLLGASTVGTFLYGTSNKYNYKINHILFHHPQVPAAFNGMRIAHITDIHTGSLDDKEAVRKGMRLIMDQKPDIILFTGDIVNSIHDELVPFVDIFSELSAPMGVFAVLGNHDYGDYYKWENEEKKQDNFNKLKSLFPKMGWELILNDNIVFDKYGSRLGLIGVENWSANSRFPKYGRLADSIETLKDKNSDFNILMTHDPSHWRAEVLNADVDIHLTLSGHTHGMQFGINIPQLKWSPVKYVYDEWLGLYNDGEKYLYVNPGFGFIGYKGRVGILPEITIIELKSKA